MEKILLVEDRYGPKSNHLEDDDMIDRLNNRITVMVLVMCILILAGGVLVGKQINCWTPAEFKGQHDTYANSICWLRGSYYLPTEEITIPDRSKPRTYFVSYYQWTPFILLGMAIFFLIPRYIWEGFTRQSGLNIKKLVKKVKEEKEQDKGVESVSTTLRLYLDSRQARLESMCCGFSCLKINRSFTVMYYFTKVLYTINSLAQFFLLNAFLSFNFVGFAPEGISKLLSDGDWFESPRFPRVTMCDFMVRRLGSNQHWYSVQCNLPINMFNEKIFLGIWIWLIILTVLNFLSIFPWLTFLSRQKRSSAVRKYLRIAEPLSEERKRLLTSSEPSTYRTSESPKDVAGFIDYLNADGFMVFYIIAINTDEASAGQIINKLYQHFSSKRKNSESEV